MTTHHDIRRFRRKIIKLHNRFTGLAELNDEIQIGESTIADDLFDAIFDQYLTDQEEEEMIRYACRCQEALNHDGLGSDGDSYERDSYVIRVNENVNDIQLRRKDSLSDSQI